MKILVVFVALIVCALCRPYFVEAFNRPNVPLLSYLQLNNSAYKQVFNPSWIEASPGTSNRSGLLIRTQDCEYEENKCNFCGGSANKASILTISQVSRPDNFTPITKSNVSFGPSSDEDSWGTEDPRMAYNKADGNYYMFYTAYNGSSILLSLATTTNPFNHTEWRKLGPVFPKYQNSKSGALLIRDKGPHYLFWGDSVIRVAKSDNLTSWPDIGEVFLEPREDHFDSKLVESGPPPLLLSDGNYIFFYNSAEKGWPEDPAAGYHPGWVILDGKDPTKIIQRSQKPLMYPVYNYEKGTAPFSCNAPNVVFLQAATQVQSDFFAVYYGAADAVIGHAVVGVEVPIKNIKTQ